MDATGMNHARSSDRGVVGSSCEGLEFHHKSRREMPKPLGRKQILAVANQHE